MLTTPRLATPSLATLTLAILTMDTLTMAIPTLAILTRCSLCSMSSLSAAMLSSSCSQHSRASRCAATLCAGGCNPMCWRLQPYVLEAATPCARGRNPVFEGATHVLKAAWYVQGICMVHLHAHVHAHAHAHVHMCMHSTCTCACAGARDKRAARLRRHCAQPALAHPVRACADVRWQQGRVRRCSSAGSEGCRRVAFEPLLPLTVTWGYATVKKTTSSAEVQSWFKAAKYRSILYGLSLSNLPLSVFGICTGCAQVKQI